MKTFKEISEGIADEFLQSIVFIDDKAYVGASDTDAKHDFDVLEVTKAFSVNNKICAVYPATSESDIESFALIAQKADVAVIDWQINLSSKAIDETDDEADDETDDLRGQHTKKIILSLLESVSNQNSLKLIIVYTGEVDLANIASDIYESIESRSIEGFKIPEDNQFCVSSSSCSIQVIAKSNNGEERGRHQPALKKRSISYEKLPEFINQEFSSLTGGLLSNFALKSLTEIRKNFYQIIKIFSKDLDPAYLAHQSLLENVDNANDLLVELLGDTLISIMRANGLHNSVDLASTEAWLDDFIQNSQEHTFSNSRAKVRDKKLLMDVLEPSSHVGKKFKNLFDLSNREVDKKKYKNYAMECFSDEDIEDINKRFACLCQHKDLIYYDDHQPVLSLGSVVKSSLGGYFVCIQQRCDSVRILKEPRRFLFLSLTKGKEDEVFDFLSPEGIRLKLENSTYDIRTVKFDHSESGVVSAVKMHDGRLCFIPSPTHSQQEEFEFKFELKDLYAQRLVSNYSASLARVGLDEPEWVRLNS